MTSIMVNKFSSYKSRYSGFEIRHTDSFSFLQKFKFIYILKNFNCVKHFVYIEVITKIHTSKQIEGTYLKYSFKNDIKAKYTRLQLFIFNYCIV